MTTDRVPILWLVGPSGVGKTTLARAIYARLGRSGITAAHIDIDMISLIFPASDADPFHHRLKARNLGAVWPVYRDAGAQCLVLAGSIEEPAHVALYADRVPGALVTVCQIRLDAADHRARIEERNGKSVAWADDLIAEGEAMGRSGFADVVAETGGLSVPDAVERVLADCGGWPVIEVSAVPVLWLHDPTALEQSQGKSEIGWQLLMQVSRDGVKVAYIDLPHYAFLAPAPADDPGNRRIKAGCIAALWPGFAGESAQCVIVFSSTDGADLASGWVEAAIPGAQLTFRRVEPGWQDASETAALVRASARGWPGPAIASGI